MRKPRLTKRIVNGLRSVRALADVNQFVDSDLYAGTDEKERADIEAAIRWIGRLIHWHSNRVHLPSGNQTPSLAPNPEITDYQEC